MGTFSRATLTIPARASGDAGVATSDRPTFAAQCALAEPRKGYHTVKRCLDLAVALPMLVVFAIMFLLVGVCLLLEDGYPILYTRKAVGLDGKPFQIVKFRSMRKDADTYFETHPEQQTAFQQDMKLKDDPRILRVGRFIRRASIDEIPQVLNVVRGEMSFVGPRYVQPDELQRYGAFAEIRTRMLPGVTGLWQVGGRNNIPYEQRVIFDRTYYYVRSIRTDIAILLRTIPAVLSRRGAF
jgi:lipopolysaccharide/colanic/teichoic acid biosynthesis glycosyltransferase